MTLRDLIEELDAAMGEADAEEAAEPTRKVPALQKPGWHPKKKKFMHHPMHNKSGPSTTAPTRKVPASSLPRSR